MPLSHEYIGKLLVQLRDISRSSSFNIDDLAPYLDMPDYAQIMNGYLVIADELERAVVFEGRHYLMKLDFLFNVINVSGLSDIHNACLIEINRCLGKVLKDESHEDINDFIRKNIFTC
jgi:pyruvate,orthophosphate dikinase